MCSMDVDQSERSCSWRALQHTCACAVQMLRLAIRSKTPSPDLPRRAGRAAEPDVGISAMTSKESRKGLSAAESRLRFRNYAGSSPA